MKRGGGRRYYRPEDLDLLRGIRHLLYGEGYTIRGVQRLLREQGLRFVQNVWQPGAPQPGLRAAEEDETEGAATAASARGGEHDEGGDEPSEEEAAPARAPASGRLGREELAKLKAALQELSECRRLLDTALAAKA